MLFARRIPGVNRAGISNRATGKPRATLQPSGPEVCIDRFHAFISLTNSPRRSELYILKPGVLFMKSRKNRKTPVMAALGPAALFILLAAPAAAQGNAYSAGVVDDWSH